MSDGPENLVLVQLREMRREQQAAMQAVVTSMNAIQRVFARLEQFQDDVAKVHAELAEFRTETRRNFVKLEGDLVALENQNISRHGETLWLLRRVDKLERSAP